MTNDKVTKAKTRLVLRVPFIASILLGCNITEDASLSPPTMATDGKNIWFHPDAVAEWSIDEIMGVLAHEVMHIACLHPWRRGHREPTRANKAMDYAINGILEEFGLTLPPNRLRSAAYDGKSFEEIYTMLPPEEQGQGGGDGHDQFDNVRDAPGTEAERQQSEAEAHVRIKQAANQAKAQGKLPASLAKLVDEVLEPKVDWRAELRRYMTAISKTDQSWARGQRRFLAQGLYLPAFHTPAMGKVSIIIDTSGSVYDEAPAFLDEVRAICEECKPESIEVLQVDAQVQAHDTYEVGEPINCTIKGGGGTDLRTGFAAVFDAPSVLVCLTDLETPFPDAPDYPVIWCATTKHEVPFGDVIRL